MPFEDGDSVASALYRAGVRTLSRSLKYHRRRGIYCGTGDCPNCLLTVDGLPAVHACTTTCGEGMRVERPGGWPNADRDLMHVTDSLHRVMPVGFYYKTFIRPRFAWAVAERVIRRATGLGTLPQTTAAERQVVRHQHVEVLVIGAGTAGLEAARDAAAAGADSVLVCNEGPIGRGVAPGPTRDRLMELASEVRSLETVTVLEDHTALGLYEGLHVPLAGDGVLVHVASGAGRGGDGGGRGARRLPRQRPARRDAGARGGGAGRCARGAARRPCRGRGADRRGPGAPTDVGRRRGGGGRDGGQRRARRSPARGGGRGRARRRGA